MPKNRCAKVWKHTCLAILFNIKVNGFFLSQNRGSLPSWEGTPISQQDALHLQSPENFLATFLMVISFTSFQDTSRITLKKIRLK
jgi:hypothetical protein